MTVVFSLIVLQGKPAAPHPSRRLRRTARETAPPVGGGPRSPRTPPLSNGFPRSSGGRAFPQKEVSSVAGKVLELQESPAAWACPRVPPTPPSRSPAAAPSPRAPARWSQAAPEGSDRPLPAIVSLDGVLGRPALPVSPPEPGSLTSPPPFAARGRPSAPLPAASSSAGRAWLPGQPARPGVRSYRGNGARGRGGGRLGLSSRSRRTRSAAPQAAGRGRRTARGVTAPGEVGGRRWFLPHPGPPLP